MKTNSQYAKLNKLKTLVPNAGTETLQWCLVLDIEDPAEILKYDEALKNPTSSSAGPVLKELLTEIRVNTAEFRAVLENRLNQNKTEQE